MKRVVEAEQYFTSTGVVRQCLDLVRKHYRFDDFGLIVEPCAGAGAFLVELPADKRIGLDILPLHDEIKVQDFLHWEPASASGKTLPNKVLTIGNPPFGRRAKLAVQFIEKAAEFSDVIAFILPRSFNKYTFQNRVPSNFYLVDSLEAQDFETPDGEPLTIKSVFQIWEKRDTPRAKLKVERTHPDFELRHAHLSRVTPAQMTQLHQEYEFAIPQVGKIFTPRDADGITKGSYWFVKPIKPEVRQIFESLDFTFLDNMNVNLKSISKADIVTAYRAAQPTVKVKNS